MHIRSLLALVLLAAALLAPTLAPAQQVRTGNSGADTLGRVVPRVAPQRAHTAITTTDGRVALLLRERGVVLQLTDRGLEEVMAEEPSEKDGEEGESVLAQVLHAMVRGGVRTLLDHGIEYPLAALADARYEAGRLVLVGHDGDPVFDSVEVNGVEVMESFRPRDARAFVARFREAKARGGL